MFYSTTTLTSYAFSAILFSSNLISRQSTYIQKKSQKITLICRCMNLFNLIKCYFKVRLHESIDFHSICLKSLIFSFWNSVVLFISLCNFFWLIKIKLLFFASIHINFYFLKTKVYIFNNVDFSLLSFITLIWH